MKRIFLAAAIVVLSSTAWAWQQRAPLPTQTCQQQFGEVKTTFNPTGTTLICRQGYFTLHDNLVKVPIWTAWRVTPQTVNGCWPRTNAFAADQSLPRDQRSEPKDYAGTGYDQGHIANDAHQSWDQQVELESFLMSNMAPQLPGLNRGIWKLLESATGAWSYSRQHSLLVYAGSIYGKKDQRIGTNQVIVPHAFWKIIIDQQTGETLAFLFPHREDLGSDLSRVQVSVAKVEYETGLVFATNDNKQLVRPLWPTDYKSVAAAKKQLCGRSE